METEINIAQKKQIMKLLRYDEEAKATVVVQLTGNCERSSLSDLTFAQANKLIELLGGKPANDYGWAYFDKFNKQHMYIVSLCMQTGWTKLHPRYGHVADLERLSNFLKSNRSPAQKPLSSMTREELSKTITAIEGVAKHNYKR